MRRLVAIASVLVMLVLLGLAQLVLPGIAAQSLRDRLQRSGRVLDVQVHAFPAIELLWHHADSVVVRLASYHSTSSGIGTTLDQSSDVGSLDASVGRLDTGLLTLRNASLHKRGDVLTGRADVTEADLRAALPILQSVKPVASGNGQLTLQGTATLFGVTATVNANVRVQDGAIVVAPDVPLGALATIKVFSNPHLAVQSVGAGPTSDGFAVLATGRLH